MMAKMQNSKSSATISNIVLKGNSPENELHIDFLKSPAENELYI
jgi:hypothetical protein